MTSNKQFQFEKKLFCGNPRWEFDFFESVYCIAEEQEKH